MSGEVENSQQLNGTIQNNVQLNGTITTGGQSIQYTAGTGIDITNNVISNTSQVYSMAESRIGTWINGEPIYRKVIALDRFPTKGEYRHFAHGISNLRWITNVQIYGYNGTDTFLQVPFVSTNDIVDFFFDFSDLIILSKLDASLYTGYAVIEYLRD